MTEGIAAEVRATRRFRFLSRRRRLFGFVTKRQAFQGCGSFQLRGPRLQRLLRFATLRVLCVAPVRRGIERRCPVGRSPRRGYHRVFAIRILAVPNLDKKEMLWGVSVFGLQSRGGRLEYRNTLVPAYRRPRTDREAKRLPRETACDPRTAETTGADRIFFDFPKEPGGLGGVADGTPTV